MYQHRRRSTASLLSITAMTLFLAACQRGRTVLSATPVGAIASPVYPTSTLAYSISTPQSIATTSSPAVAGTSILVDGLPFGLAFSRGVLWVLVRTATFAPHGSVLAIDPATHQAIGLPIQLDFDPWSLAATDDWVWVAKNGPGALVQADPVTRQIVATLAIDASLVGADAHGVWVASSSDQAQTVLRIDPASHNIGPPIPVGLEPIQMVTGAGAVWVGSHSEGTVTRIEPETGEVAATIDVGFPVHGLGAGPDTVWAADYHGWKAVRISPTTNQVVGEPLSLPFPPYAIAVSDTDAWIGVSAIGNEADPMDDRVVRIDLRTNAITETVHVDGRPIAMTMGAGSLWVATVQPSRIVQIVP